MTIMTIMTIITIMALGGCESPPQRLDDFDQWQPVRRCDNFSPWYPIDADEIELFQDSCAYDARSAGPATSLEIQDRALQMIEEAEHFVVLSFFLFDNLYDAGRTDGPDIVRELADAILAKRTACPDVPIVLMLDQIHNVWGNRRSPIVEELSKGGVDVFYSDLLDTRSASRVGLYECLNEVGRGIDPLTGGLLAGLTQVVGAAPIPGAKFDDAQVTLGTLGNALYFKANHRKILVTGSSNGYEAMVTSWNPHNGSALNENHALVVRGRLARYIYMVAREDVARSIELGDDYVEWSNRSEAEHETFLTERLPALAYEEYMPDDESRRGSSACAAFATEAAIEAGILDMLEQVGPEDEVRIQMFYLSRPAVIEAILDAAARTRTPVRLLLDPNRGSFVGNGTPNAQVARYILQRAREEGLRLEIRWCLSTGEQNHAKAMTITAPRSDKYQITVGSANWTRKNLAGINLEANLFVEGAAAVNERFNSLFDRMWWNLDEGTIFSLAYDDPRLQESGEPWMIEWAVVLDLPALGHEPIMIESDLVHW